ncbi:MAG: FHA domain-containing protein [Chloroflexi bacterium]|nr:FHA domain-containing protein [Chloroflexota bacterium]
MNICPECNYENRVGELFCQDCGNPLFDGDAGTGRDKRSTRQLGNTVEPQEIDAVQIAGTSHLGQNAQLLIYVKDNEDPIVLEPTAEMMVGRSDAKSNHYPDIDLTPFGALEEGVSRTHARLRRDGDTVTVSDMDSVNGTYLNGQKLRPHMPRIVRDGDEIRFGRMVLHIYFKRL